jgi:hypothetical protein
MRRLQKFKIKDGELVVCTRKPTDVTDDGTLLLVNEVMLMLKEELYTINSSLQDPIYNDVTKLDEWNKKQKWALESKQLMIEEFIKKINQ